jgi:hypothetical protein
MNANGDDLTAEFMTAADNVVGMELAVGTKELYASKLKTIKKFFISCRFCEDALDEDDEIIVPISMSNIKLLFGYLATNKEMAKKKKSRGSTIVDDDDASIVMVVTTNHSNVVDQLVNVGGTVDDNVSVASEMPTTVNLSIGSSLYPTISFSTMQQYNSSIKHLYKKRNYVMEKSTEQYLHQFLKGYKSLVATKKANGIMDVNEGKRPLSFGGYVQLAETFETLAPKRAKYSFDEGIFAWCFLLLSWNMMARSASVGNIYLQHIDWQGDCLVINIPKHKGDQTGEGLGHAKHIYANTVNSHICPILALAIYIFCSGELNGTYSGNKLFPGDEPEGRFTKVLSSILKEDDRPLELGASRLDIGTHSNRKGSASFALSKHEVQAAQVFMRAGWSLGNVGDRYLHPDSGDHLVGRTVSGLPITSENFAALPPRFSPTDLEIIDAIGWNILLAGKKKHNDYFLISRNFQESTVFWTYRL